ncbi:MAG: pentapeptide repeat-containing protein [Myxococcales bacterium]|nr:pentapeptide repeat-containing protein [Myxococcales bacterium]
MEEGANFTEGSGIEVVGVLSQYAGIGLYQGQDAEGTPVTILRAEDELAAPVVARLQDLQPRLAPLAGVLHLGGGIQAEWSYALVDSTGTAADLPALSWNLARRLETFRTVAMAIQGIHEAGMGYGPFAPEHVLLDADLSPVLLGPGLVDMVPNYTAPEAREQPVPGIPSDVFTLGRFLHYVLTQNLPPDVDDVLPRLDDLSAMPAGLMRIVRRATTSELGHRYGTVAEFIADLDNYGDYENVGFPHPDVPEYNRGTTSFVPQKAAPVVTPASARQSKVDVPKAAKGKGGKKREGPLVTITKPIRAAMIGGGALLALPVMALPFAVDVPHWLGWAMSLGLGVFAAGVVPIGVNKENVLRLWMGLLLFTSTGAIDLYQRLIDIGVSGRLASNPAKNIRASIAQGNREFQRINIAGADLSGIALMAVDFSGANLQQVNFRKTMIMGGDFSGASMNGANLMGTRFGRTKLEGVVGLDEAECDEDTRMPEPWTCVNGHPTNRPAPPKRGKK